MAELGFRSAEVALGCRAPDTEDKIMRGYLQPGHRVQPTDAQAYFASLSRGRRSKLSEAAGTNLVKASQWARGEGVPNEVREALERIVAEHMATKKN